MKNLVLLLISIWIVFPANAVTLKKKFTINLAEEGIEVADFYKIHSQLNHSFHQNSFTGRFLNTYFQYYNHHPLRQYDQQALLATRWNRSRQATTADVLIFYTDNVNDPDGKIKETEVKIEFGIKKGARETLEVSTEIRYSPLMNALINTYFFFQGRQDRVVARKTTTKLKLISSNRLEFNYTVDAYGRSVTTQAQQKEFETLLQATINTLKNFDK